MNSLKCLFIVVLCLWQTVAPGQGISFREGSLQEALEEAKISHKMVFVEFMVAGSVACKQMENEVFDLTEVGKLINERFVCVRIDVGQCQSLVQAYKIKGLPACVFLNADGNVIGRLNGQCDVSLFEHQVKVLTGDKPTLSELWNTYKANKDDVKIQQQVLREFPFYLKLIEDREEADRWQGRVDKLFKEYWEIRSSADRVLNKECLCLILLYCEKPRKNCEPIEYVIKHYEEFSKMLPVQTMISFFASYMNTLINELAKKGDIDYKKVLARLDGDLKPIFDAVQTQSLPVKYLMTSKADALYALYGKKDQKEYVAQVSMFLEKMGDLAGWEEYDQVVMNLLAFSGKRLKPEAAERALLWLDKLLSFKLDADYQALYISSMGDCYAALRDDEKAKECYNQAYLISFQTQNVKIQNYLRQKMSALPQ